MTDAEKIEKLRAAVKAMTKDRDRHACNAVELMRQRDEAQAHYENMWQQKEAVRIELAEAQWKPITPDTTFDEDKWYGTVGIVGDVHFYKIIFGQWFQRPDAAIHLLFLGRTHYRALNPPAK